SVLIKSSKNELDPPKQSRPVERSRSGAEEVSEGRGSDGSLLPVESLNEGRSPPHKKRRLTRKLTAWIFVDLTDDGKLGWCRLGCLNNSGSERHSYVIASTTSVTRHLEPKHPSFFEKFKFAQDTRYNVATL